MRMACASIRVSAEGAHIEEQYTHCDFRGKIALTALRHRGAMAAAQTRTGVSVSEHSRSSSRSSTAPESAFSSSDQGISARVMCGSARYRLMDTMEYHGISENLRTAGNCSMMSDTSERSRASFLFTRVTLRTREERGRGKVKDG